MFSSNPKDQDNFFEASKDRKKASKQLYLNMALCLVVIFSGILACNWIFSDISGVYMVESSGGQSPVVLSLVRKVTSVEGELIIPRAGYFYLVNSNFKDEKLHLEFRPKEEVEKKRGKIILLTLDGKFENDKITGVLQSSLGKKPQKIVLKREPGSSLHKILQSHMPHL